MKIFMIPRWGLNIPGCGEKSTMSPRKTVNQPVGFGFHTLRGGVDAGDVRFRPRVVGVVYILKGI